MGGLQDEAHSAGDFFPGGDAGFQFGSALVGEGVVSPDACAVVGAIFARDADLALAFKGIEKRIKRSLPESENPVAAPAQFGGELIAIHWPLGQKLQDKGAGAAFEELGLGFHSM